MKRFNYDLIWDWQGFRSLIYFDKCIYNLHTSIGERRRAVCVFFQSIDFIYGSKDPIIFLDFKEMFRIYSLCPC